MDKDLVKKLYLEGYNAAEIAKIVLKTKGSVQKHIQRHLSNKKHLHERAVITRREALKAINYEANKYMSDKSFILKNRSIYKTKKNGDIVLKNIDEIGCAIPWDAPRRLVNEMSCN